MTEVNPSSKAFGSSQSAGKRKLLSGILIFAVVAASLAAVSWQLRKHENDLAELEQLRQERDEAISLAKRTRDDCDKAELTMYAFQIAQAQYAWNQLEVSRARTILDRTSAERRGWEHEYLSSRLNRAR